MNVTDPIYKKAVAVVAKLDQDGLLVKLSGNCVVAAELIQNMLHAEGISSRTVEVQLLASRPDSLEGVSTIALVGYNTGTDMSHHVATHVVVITQGEEPLLIDASIGHILQNPRHVIITPTTPSNDSDIICRAEANGIDLNYRVKKRIQLPQLHEKSIVEKIRQEYNLLQNIRWIRYGVIVAISMSTINFVLNSILVVLKLTYL
jgi:hypothetical protein